MNVFRAATAAGGSGGGSGWRSSSRGGAEPDPAEGPAAGPGPPRVEWRPRRKARGGKPASAQGYLLVEGCPLEAELVRTGRGAAAAVILHPYPWLGGCMYDHVCDAVFQQLRAHEDVNTVLRYNSAGVGHSGGGFPSLLGGPECEQLRKVCDFLCRGLEDPPARLYVVGYSWGACIGASVLDHDGVRGYVGISIPIGYIASLFLRTEKFWHLCRGSAVPKLFVHGARDNFTSIRFLRKGLEDCRGPHQLLEYGDDHFWMHSVQEVAEQVASWLGYRDGQLRKAAGGDGGEDQGEDQGEGGGGGEAPG